MRNAPKAVVTQTVGTLFQLGTTGEWSDGDLLNRFLGCEEETRSAAFEVLVDRHGPMVFDVCRNVLRDDHEAEDAFQATFLILARQARAIRKRESVGSWLFGVASRVASRAKVDAARRRARERAFAKEVAAHAPRNCDDAAKAALHEEIAHLPEKYREPIVLCYLEGMSYQAVAERLGCPVGTVSVRLMRAREHLRTRLVRRGEVLPAIGDGESMVTPNERQLVTPALVASLARRASALVANRVPGTRLIPSSIMNLIEEATMAIVARHAVARSVGAVIVGSLLVGSGILGYRALGRGSLPETTFAQPPGVDPEPAKAQVEDPALTALHWVDSMEKLGKIGSAINAFHEANGFLPPDAIRDPNTGKPLLSWRVAILPWIGAKDLYQQFHLDEAWDSPHNKELMARMPFEYAPVGNTTWVPFTTFYQVFVGPGTAFESLPNDGKLRMTSIRDGAGNTLAVVEAGSVVPWTKPEDLPFLPDRPLPPLGGMIKDGFNIVCLDGSVYSFPRDFDARVLKALITRAGAEPINRDQLHQGPLVRRPTDRAALAQLKVAKQALKTIEERHRTGVEVSGEDYHKWSLRTLEAERASAGTKGEEITALEAHFKRMKALNERFGTLHQTGERDMLQYLDTIYWYEEAAGWLQ